MVRRMLSLRSLYEMLLFLLPLIVTWGETGNSSGHCANITCPEHSICLVDEYEYCQCDINYVAIKINGQILSCMECPENNYTCSCDEYYVPMYYNGKLSMCYLGLYLGICGVNDICSKDSQCKQWNTTLFTCVCKQRCSAFDDDGSYCEDMCSSYDELYHLGDRTCQNGGTCQNDPHCDYTIYNTSCTCPPGYTGKTCEKFGEFLLESDSSCAKDIAFLVGGSGLLSPIAEMTRAFHIGPELNNTHFALLLFNTGAPRFNLKDYLSNDDVYWTIFNSAPSLTYDHGVVELGMATALSQVFVPPSNRPEAQNYLIIITEYDVNILTKPAQSVNVIVYIVSTDVRNKTNLDIIAGDPDRAYVINYPHHLAEALINITRSISATDCFTMPDPAPDTASTIETPGKHLAWWHDYYLILIVFCVVVVIILLAVYYYCLIHTRDWHLHSRSVRYDQTAMIGNGSTSFVYKGVFKQSFWKSHNVAVKVSAQKSIELELKVLIMINKHPNIIGFFGIYSQDDNHGLVFELALGNLLNYVKRLTMKTFDLAFARKIMTEIASGMVHLTSLCIVHRDLAARNVLLSASMQAKISDFGLCCFNGAESETTRLPVKWLAIEALENGQFSEKSDIWSFGVLLYELFSFGRGPYEELTPQVDIMLQYLRCGNRLGRPEMATDKIYNLMVLCWLEDPSLRPSFTMLSSMSDESYDYTKVYRNCHIQELCNAVTLENGSIE